MATSAFKSTTRRTPIGTNSPPSTDDSPDSSSSKSHWRSRSLSRFSRPIPVEIERDVAPTPRRKFVNTVRGSEFPEISLDDLAIDFFYNSSELDDESVSSRPIRVKSETSHGASHRRSRSVSRHPNGDNTVVSGSATASAQRRGRSVSRRSDGNGTASNAGGTTKVVPNADSRRRRSVSVARHQISDTESDIDLSLSSAIRPKSRSMNNRVASFQRPTASSHRRLTRSMSQAPKLRSHDDYASLSSALTDDDLRDGCYGKNEIEKTIRAVYAQKKIDHPIGDDANHGIREAMRKELRSAVNDIMLELEQHKQDLSVERALEEQQVQNGFKIVREVLPESNNKANEPKVSYSEKRSNDRNRVSKRLNEEAEKYFEDFTSNVEDTDFSSFDGERSDTSSSLGGTTAAKLRDIALLPTQKGNNISLPVEMEGINLPWLEWDDNDGVPLTTPKTKLWDPSKDLKMIQDHGNQSCSSHGSWNPEHTTTNSTNAKGNRIKETKSSRFDSGKYFELKRTEELLFDSWRERSVIKSSGLLLCSVITPF